MEDVFIFDSEIAALERLIEELRPVEPMPDFDEELEELPLHD